MLAACAALAGVAVADARPQAKAPCAGAAAATATSRVSLEAAAFAAADSTRAVRVCLRPARGTQVGSFHLVIEYESTAVRALRFSPGVSGSEVANLTHAGRADVAGAAPSGFARGVLLQLDFARADGRRTGDPLGTMIVRLLELNGTDGANLVSHSAVAGLDAGGRSGQPRAAAATAAAVVVSRAPHIDRLEPSRAPIAPGAPVQVMIHGSGFRPEGNLVLLGDVAIGELSSSDGATLRLLLPDALPSRAEVPPRRLVPGSYDIRVRTGAGTSNRKEFVLEMPR